MPMVFQDPFASLNPVHRIGYTLGRGLQLHRPGLSRAERDAAAEAALEAVGLSPARQTLEKYPHELSGGQRQRVGFALALSYQPKMVLADEPVSMLDVSIRIGLLNLMAFLCAAQKISFLYITHDIASARYVSQRIVVMYAGRIVETGVTEDVLRGPVHPYTRLLLAAVPDPKAPLAVDGVDMGEPPLVIEPGEGCRFLRRCPMAVAVCASVTPALRDLGQGQAAACHVTAG
jgi:peptide/nickel transport system ATP-binding protein